MSHSEAAEEPGLATRAAACLIAAIAVGTPPPPLENLPNRVGEDPHGAPRGVPTAAAMANEFLAPRGRITNVCGDAPCFAGGWAGP